MTTKLLTEIANPFRSFFTSEQPPKDHRGGWLEDIIHTTLQSLPLELSSFSTKKRRLIFESTDTWTLLWEIWCMDSLIQFNKRQAALTTYNKSLRLALDSWPTTFSTWKPTGKATCCVSTGLPLIQVYGSHSFISTCTCKLLIITLTSKPL